jgi:hypothetical protein
MLTLRWKRLLTLKKILVTKLMPWKGPPTTQHSDVLEDLQRDLEDAAREALINRVFYLDSRWNIVGFLLSQSVIEKNDQRVTATLLGYVAQHVHFSKVVKMIAIFLKNPRRKKLSFQLHKQSSECYLMQFF